MSEEDKIRRFLSNFQELEDIINEKGGHKSRFNDNLMAISISNAYIRAKQGEILDLYVLRNVYSHMQRGKYFASLTDHAVNSLELLLKDIKYFPSVLEV